MNKFLSIACTIGLLGGGVGLVVIADRAGWLAPPRGAELGQQISKGSNQRTVSNVPLMESASSDSAPNIQLIANNTVPRSQRPPSAICTTEQLIVQFDSPAVAERAGLTLVPAQSRAITQTLQCNAHLDFNADRYAHISPRASGVVHRVEKQLGDRVNDGDVLAVIDSVQLGSAKAQLLQAHAAANLWTQNFERQRTLADSGISSQRDLLEAQTKLTEASIALSHATQQLLNLGISREQIDEITRTEDTGSLLSIAAPFAGVVVDRHAVLGEVVDSNHAMFSIADTSDLWAMIDVYEVDAHAIEVGQHVTLHLAGRTGDPVTGRITWISPQVDQHTRTLKARAEIANPDATLRANMFGKAIITIHDREQMLVVPKQAVQWEGCCNVVFVKKSSTQFQPRKVQLGYEVDGWCAIKDGVEPDELVVAQGSFLLKTEVLKGSIGAGCCAEH